MLSEIRANCASEDESKHPEGASLFMPPRGISTMMPVLRSHNMRDSRFYKFWVYIVCSPSGTLYIGLTGRINVRIKQHKTEALEGFTQQYGCKRLVYYESYDSFYSAERREKQLKGWRRAKKIVLIEKVNPRWQDLAEHWGWKMLFRGQSLAEIP